MENKKCNKCHVVKSADNFRLKKTNKKYYKLYYICIECEKEAKIIYRKGKQHDPSFYLRHWVSATIRTVLFKNGTSKRGYSVMQKLSYDITQLKQHLESLFEPWMNWENYGVYSPKQWDDNSLSTWTWQIDHIIPQSVLPYKNMDEENFKRVWALKNLRPYSAKQNIIDGSLRSRHKLFLEHPEMFDDITPNIVLQYIQPTHKNCKVCKQNKEINDDNFKFCKGKINSRGLRNKGQYSAICKVCLNKKRDKSV